ncbi:formin-like protein 6 [Zingiber officinale]|uniref:VQ domain-containing protein n=1 Tax=Zingiber officinale TaxID=94328 RepID=A0A8J5KDF3_ZINOF|nr:formin-like protein 6 [Zingiber officinale]KAG6485612.1 hypothetical protein ZIOFF_054175 [Zingiber officinale]
MESTNSGSVQSSSSGDNEEYDAVVDSPAPSSSSFLNLPPPPPPPPATTPPASSSIFDSFSPYFTPFPFQPPPPEHAAAWSLSPPPPPPPLSTSAPSSTRGGPTPPPVQPPAAAPRGPKKRTRASRRAPTTVINTETSNFRSMVQQFTGFPSPPFAGAAASPQFQSPGLQLDLFGSSPAAVPQFLLRPSAQKMIPSPASSSASPSLFDHIIARSNVASIGNSSITSADVDGAPNYHDKFPLSLFEQQPDAANRGTERGSFIPPAFLQPQRAQMAQLPAEFARGSPGSLIATGAAAAAATNITYNNRPRRDVGLCWDVNEQSGEERRPASSIEDQQPYQKLWRPNLD